MTSPELLVARRASDRLVVEFISALKETPAEDRFADFEVRDYPKSGISIYIDDDTLITTVFMYDGSDADHRRYRGELPYGLQFGDDANAVESRWERPTRRASRSLLDSAGAASTIRTSSCIFSSGRLDAFA
jgi:hypothetical protein